MSLITGLVLMVIGVVLVIVANFMTFAIIDEINARSSSNEQISLAFIQLKTDEIFRRHRELLPNSKKRRQSTMVAIAGLALIFLGFAVGSSSISVR